MNSTLSNIIIFVAGAAIGSFATWKYVKTKYERIAEEEIAEMREYVHSKSKQNDANVDYDVMSDEDKEEYDTLIRQYNEEEMDDTRRPYVIMPDQFSEFADYETISLTYYADGILASDDTDEIIDNVEEIIGVDSLKHFGEFEDDSVYVRNDERKCDYEILRDNRKYTDVVGND